MKALMKKVNGFKEDIVDDTKPTEPKKIRNRSLFYVKVSKHCRVSQFIYKCLYLKKLKYII